ncbi:Alpha/Beta hydrolase protein [Mariannaea sp. PMI_226]|nr:Alpha/Beta hydrolase protein [Mariannaea sp. PMI_226]
MRASSYLFGAVAAVSVPYTAADLAVDCKITTFPITVTANNFNLTGDYDPNNATSIDSFVNQALSTGVVGSGGEVTTSASLSISAQYCAPNGSKNLNKIQVLVHGNTCDRTIWDALGQSSLQQENYSYQRYFASRGYATLAIDMPGHGKSTFPDPNTIVQMPLEAAIINAITASLRSKRNPIGITFSKIAFVGHSYGSITGVAAARLTPGFADALIMTGWSAYLPLPSPLLELQMHSAALLFDRFKTLPLGYLTASNKTGHKNIFFGGSFDPQIPETSFLLQSVMTCGEGGSLVTGLQPATVYNGKVLVITGSDDVLFCNPMNGACTDQLSGSTILLPNATSFNTQVIPNTGHNFMLHKSNIDSFNQIKQFIDGEL